MSLPLSRQSLIGDGVTNLVPRIFFKLVGGLIDYGLLPRFPESHCRLYSLKFLFSKVGEKLR
jgi:hypothetical protein